MATILNDAPYMGFPLSIKRGNPAPVDTTAVWYSKAELETYATSGATAYVGQILTLVENDKCEAYMIASEAGTLVKLAQTTASGDLASDVANLQTQVSNLVEKIGKASVEDIPGTGIIKDIEDLKKAVEANTSDITGVEEAYKQADTDLHTTITEEIATALQAAKDYADENDADTQYDDTEVKTLISEAKKAADDAAAAVQTETDQRKEADTNLENSLKQYVGEEIGKQAHFSAKVVTSLEEMTDAKTLYLVKDESVTGEDKYKEYILIEGVATLIGTTSTDLSGYVTTEVLNSTKSALQESINEVSGKVTDLETSVSTTYETKEDAASKQTALQGSIDTLSETVATKADAETTTTGINEAKASAKAAQDTADANATAITALQNADKTINESIQALQEVGSEKNVVNSVDTAEFTLSEDRKLGINAIASSKVTGLDASIAALTENVNGKVSKQSSEYNGEMKDWILLSPENQAKLAQLTIGEGGLEVSGKVNADNVEGLGSWLTTNRDSVAGLLSTEDETKLDGIADGAQVNVLEAIKVNGVALEITDKAVNLPIATVDSLGVVLSSTAENKVTVDTDGTMKVEKLNVNKLVQTDGDTLILDGGSSSL